MIKIDLTNITRIDPAHGLSMEDLKANSGLIEDFLEAIENRNQGFYKVIDEDPKEIKNFAKSTKGKFENIVILGIGGSALGATCLQKALTHWFKKPKLYVLDNIDPDFIAELEDVIDLSKTLFITISKSGGTAETLSEYFHFRKKIEDEGLEAKEHFVFTTGKDGLLRETADKEGITTFDIPENVGGRFSVLTPVGLLPAALIGIDIDALLKGAREMRDKFLSKDAGENLPFKLATIQYLLDQKGKNINVMMPYSQKLYYLADWYRQLLAESIGKTPEVGLTPLKALGVTDQHSQSQLYMEGPNDKLIMFIEVKNFENELEIPNPENIDYLENKTFTELINTEKRGTADALTQNNKPNLTIHIDEVNERNLGKLFLFFEGATAFLGEYYGIDAFNQPGVELSKKLTKEYLI